MRQWVFSEEGRHLFLEPQLTRNSLLQVRSIFPTPSELGNPVEIPRPPRRSLAESYPHLRRGLRLLVEIPEAPPIFLLLWANQERGWVIGLRVWRRANTSPGRNSARERERVNRPTNLSWQHCIAWDDATISIFTPNASEKSWLNSINDGNVIIWVWNWVITWRADLGSVKCCDVLNFSRVPFESLA